MPDWTKNFKKKHKVKYPVNEKQIIDVRFYDKVLNSFDKFSQIGLVLAIRQGLISLIPLTIVGAIAILIINFPLEAYTNMMSTILGEDWKSAFNKIYEGTFQLMSVLILLSISNSLTQQKNKVYQLKCGHKMNNMVVIMLSLACLTVISDTTTFDGLSFTHIGSQGIFVSVVVAIAVSYLYFFFYEHRIFKIAPITDETNGSLFTKSVMSIEPVAIIMLLFMVISSVFNHMGIADIHQSFYDFLSQSFSELSNGVLAAFVFVFFVHFFWFFGIHGNNVLESVAINFWGANSDKNLELIAQELAPTEILSKKFFDLFVIIGGSGATICLIIAILIHSTHSANSRISKLSIPAGLFNINETMIYGIPLVLNPFMLIPFIGVPIVLTFTSYFAFATGLVPIAVHDVHWTTPIIMGGYITTGSVAGAVLQVVNVVIGVLIYYPFVTLSEKSKERQNIRMLQRLNEEVNYVENNRVPILLSRQDEVGSLARTLANDILKSIEDDKELYLVYQPQTTSSGKVGGCEVLLRYNHDKYGFIPPPTVITIAEEAKIDSQLNEWIFENALEACREFRQLGYYDLVVSINISPMQLKNERIFEILHEKVELYALDPDKIEIELTENIAIEESENIQQRFTRLKKMGFRLAIDDFGMGHTSLMYMRSYDFNTVKLDGILVADILTDPNTEDIVKSIINLAEKIHMHVIAEVVETKEQRDKLESLGCHTFQGYYYSKPLVMKEFIHYSNNKIINTKY